MSYCLVSADLPRFITVQLSQEFHIFKPCYLLPGLLVLSLTSVPLPAAAVAFSRHFRFVAFPRFFQAFPSLTSDTIGVIESILQRQVIPYSASIS